MSKRLAVLFGVLFVVCAFFIAPSAKAAFAADRGALVLDSTYFIDRGFDNASAMIKDAEQNKCESYVLVFYSRYNNACKVLIPQIQQWAEENKIRVYGIDQYNKYIREYGYFNIKTSFEGWEKYISRNSFAFPAVFIYNSDTRILHAKNGIVDVADFEQAIKDAGLIGAPYHDYYAAEKSAESLNLLGLFRGTDDGFDLLRRPTRAEALVMLLRLLGHEEEALMLDLSHPFTDVPAWASPYVGYAYRHGITEGMDELTFGASEEATSAHFMTFVLRALGYQSGEKGDFSWDDPYALALEVGALPAGVNTALFLRGEMTVVCRSALSCRIKGEETTLAQKLLYSRAFSAEALFQSVGLTEHVSSLKQEFRPATWQKAILIEPYSPSYVLEAATGAAHSRPDHIVFATYPGDEEKWASFIAENLILPKELATSFEVTVADSAVIITPSYTVAAGALACLTVPGYLHASNNEYYTATTVKQNFESILLDGAEDFCGTFFSQCEILPEEGNLPYSDADAAILLKKCTEEGLKRGRWLVYEIAEVLAQDTSKQ